MVDRFAIAVSLFAFSIIVISMVYWGVRSVRLIDRGKAEMEGIENYRDKCFKEYSYEPTFETSEYPIYEKSDVSRVRPILSDGLESETRKHIRGHRRFPKHSTRSEGRT
jgi:hypothetical protein